MQALERESRSGREWGKGAGRRKGEGAGRSFRVGTEERQGFADIYAEREF